MKGKEKREREKHQMWERNIDQPSPAHAPPGDQTHNLGMALTGIQTPYLPVDGMALQSMEPHGPGKVGHLKQDKECSLFLYFLTFSSLSWWYNEALEVLVFWVPFSYCLSL